MARYSGRESAQEHLLDVARHVVHAIHRAPQMTGKLKIETEILTDEDLVPILDVMQELAKVFRFVEWDHVLLRACYDRGEPPVLVLIGADLANADLAWDCGACGFDTCREFRAHCEELGGGGMLGGPSCNWKALDYGVVCDWSCAAAYQYRVDARIMGSIGVPLSLLNYLPGCNAKIGLPIGPAKELVYFNREDLHSTMNYEMDRHDLLQCIPTTFMAFPGGGKPAIKSKDSWWLPPEYVKVEPDAEAAALYEQVLFERVPELILKYSDQVAARYEKKGKAKKGKK